MDDFTEFVSSSVEFIVGGAMLLATLVVWWACLESGPGDLEELSRAVGVLPGAAITFGLIIVSYAAGVIVESLSRMCFERVLDYETRYCYWDAQPARAPESSDEQISPPRSAWTAYKAWWRLDRSARGAETRIAQTEREKQRAAVMFTSPVLYADVASQLRRLRLERVTSVCAFLTAIPLFIDERPVAAGCAVLLGGVMVYLVYKRCSRFVGVIKRTYLQILDSQRLEMKL